MSVLHIKAQLLHRSLRTVPQSLNPVVDGAAADDIKWGTCQSFCQNGVMVLDRRPMVLVPITGVGVEEERARAKGLQVYGCAKHMRSIKNI